MAEVWDGYLQSPSVLPPSIPVCYKVINLLTSTVVNCSTLLELDLQFYAVIDTFEVSKMSAWTYKTYGNYRVEAIPLED